MEELNQKAAEYATKHANSIETAVDRLARWVRGRDWFPKWESELVGAQCRNAIHDARHRHNVATRKDMNGGQSKVGISAAIGELSGKLLAYNIGGRTLGVITGEELDELRTSERERAAGHRFNAVLCEKLRPLVQDDKTVAECVSSEQLMKVWKQAQNAQR